MTTSTEDTTEVAAGLNEESIASLLGDDTLQLTSVDDKESDDLGPTASTEGLCDQISTDANGGSQEQQTRDRPAVSRVIDAEGHARISIIYGPQERTTAKGTIIAFIDSASENDIVDITLVSSVTGEAGTMEQRSILSAIDRCRGTVITRAGALTTLGDVAIWLSGDVRKMSPIGCVLVRQPLAGFCGDTADYEERLKNCREAIREYSDFVVECGMFTQEEMDAMYEHRTVISLYGDKLRQRIANLKPVT